MKIPKLKLTIIIIFVGLMIIILSFGRSIPSLNIDAKFNKYESRFIPVSNSIFFRQTLNNCAPYSAMAIISIVKNEINDPEKLANETKWRMQKNLTFPQGLIDLLHKYQIKTKEYVLYPYSDKEKINWLKNNINKGNPIILLIEVSHIKHYLTIVGYDEDGLCIYDSLQEKSKNNSRMTVIDKPEYSGNRYYKNEELLKMWNAGGFMIFFSNWAVVCQ